MSTITAPTIDEILATVSRFGGKYLDRGERVVFDIVSLDEFARRAILFPFPVKKVHGVPTQCHPNVAVSEYTGAPIATGLALWGEMWYPHSWLYRYEMILETTVEFEKYFGIVLSDKERRKFKKIVGLPFDPILERKRFELWEEAQGKRGAP